VNDLRVKVWVLEPKGAGTAAAVAAFTPGTMLSFDGTLTCDWGGVGASPSAFISERLPVNQDLYRVRYEKVLALKKNQGSITGVPAAGVLPLTGAPATATWGCSFKPGVTTLHYEGLSNTPTNYNPLFAYVVYNSVSGYVYPAGIVTLSAMSHVWYKDA